MLSILEVGVVDVVRREKDAYTRCATADANKGYIISLLETRGPLHVRRSVVISETLNLIHKLCFSDAAESQKPLPNL